MCIYVSSTSPDIHYIVHMRRALLQRRSLDSRQAPRCTRACFPTDRSRIFAIHAATAAHSVPIPFVRSRKRPTPDPAPSQRLTCDVGIRAPDNRNHNHETAPALSLIMHARHAHRCSYSHSLTSTNATGTVRIHEVWQHNVSRRSLGTSRTATRAGC